MYTIFNIHYNLIFWFQSSYSDEKKTGIPCYSGDAKGNDEEKSLLFIQGSNCTITTLLRNQSMLLGEHNILMFSLFKGDNVCSWDGYYFTGLIVDINKIFISSSHVKILFCQVLHSSSSNIDYLYLYTNIYTN